MNAPRTDGLFHPLRSSRRLILPVPKSRIPHERERLAGVHQFVDGILGIGTVCCTFRGSGGPGLCHLVEPLGGGIGHLAVVESVSLCLQGEGVVGAVALVVDGVGVHVAFLHKRRLHEVLAAAENEHLGNGGFRLVDDATARFPCHVDDVGDARLEALHRLRLLGTQVDRQTIHQETAAPALVLLLQQGNGKLGSKLSHVQTRRGLDGYIAAIQIDIGHSLDGGCGDGERVATLHHHQSRVSGNLVSGLGQSLHEGGSRRVVVKLAQHGGGHAGRHADCHLVGRRFHLLGRRFNLYAARRCRVVVLRARGERNCCCATNQDGGHHP